MSENVHWYPNWPKEIEIPREGELVIFGSGGFSGHSGPAFKCQLEELSDDQFATLKQLVADYINMDLSGFGRGMDVPSHNLRIGEHSFEAYPQMLPKFDSSDCPLPIARMYSFIGNPEGFHSIGPSQPPKPRYPGINL